MLTLRYFCMEAVQHMQMNVNNLYVCHTMTVSSFFLKVSQPSAYSVYSTCSALSACACKGIGKNFLSWRFSIDQNNTLVPAYHTKRNSTVCYSQLIAVLIPWVLKVLHAYLCYVHGFLKVFYFLYSILQWTYGMPSILLWI